MFAVSYVATASRGRSAVQTVFSEAEWDQIWVGANIATMVAGAEPYGNLKNAALAVSGERIAWIGSADEGRARAAELRALHPTSPAASG